MAVAGVWGRSPNKNIVWLVPNLHSGSAMVFGLAALALHPAEPRTDFRDSATNLGLGGQRRLGWPYRLASLAICNAPNRGRYALRLTSRIPLPAKSSSAKTAPSSAKDILVDQFEDLRRQCS